MSSREKSLQTEEQLVQGFCDRKKYTRSTQRRERKPLEHNEGGLIQN